MFNEKQIYGRFGGAYVADTLIQPLCDLEEAFRSALSDSIFVEELKLLLRDFVGRPTPLIHAKRLSRHISGSEIYLKREDLAHTGAHKINNAIAQALLAKRMGKSVLIAETGAGQHGVAVASAAANLNMKAKIFMGSDDVRRQSSNVRRIRQLGAEVKSVDRGSRTLRDAINEALRQWVEDLDDSYYLIGSALGPEPYPEIVKTFQKIIGEEAKAQFFEKTQSAPDELIACVGGGSNAIGFFSPFIKDKDVKLFGVEAGGKGMKPGMHAARIGIGREGVLHGSRTLLLQNDDGNTLDTNSISAGLDYPAIGPEHSFLFESERVKYVSVCDAEAVLAFKTLSRLEGIVPALESSHALAFAMKRARVLGDGRCILVNLSGRGDKDLKIVDRFQAEGKDNEN